MSDELRPPLTTRPPLPPLPVVPALAPPSGPAAGKAASDPAKVLPFRRGGKGRPQRKRHRLLALGRYFLGALAAVGVPLTALLWVTTAAPFALADIEIRGTERLNPAAIENHLLPLLGQNLWRLDLGSVPSLLADERWIASIEAKKEPPNRLLLEIVERKPAAILTDGPRRSFVDPEGVAIATAGTPAGDSGLIEIRMGQPGVPDALVELAVQRALAAVAELRQADADWANRLEELEILSEEDFVFHTAALDFPLWVSTRQVAGRIATLKRLLPELSARYPAFESIDLRFRERIVVRPKAAAEDTATEPAVLDTSEASSDPEAEETSEGTSESAGRTTNDDELQLDFLS
ncbi:MAG: FtsQ-type POTRA domain-containing protein [Thermoanaerobaculia bacterium]|nr:FtsQ-type POTRA domain-containing protein [Thermoanaerobaculia bacterium]